MVYKWRGQRSYPVDPNEAAREISRVASKQPKGAILAAGLVDASRAKRAVLHPVIFAEDDTEAAEKHRISIAQQIVSSLVVIDQDNGNVVETPAFYHVDYIDKDDERVQGYQPVEVVIQDPDARKSAAERLLTELEGLERRYNGLSEFSEVWEAIQKARERLEEEEEEEEEEDEEKKGDEEDDDKK